MDWVEKGKAPKELIGARWNAGNVSQGLAYERKICVYPERAVYTGGDRTKASSFRCQLDKDFLKA